MVNCPKCKSELLIVVKGGVAFGWGSIYTEYMCSNPKCKYKISYKRWYD